MSRTAEEIQRDIRALGEELDDKTSEVAKLSRKIQDMMEESSVTRENDDALLIELVRDRHDRLCVWGQPLHACPDILCRDAVRVLNIGPSGR